MKSKFWGVAVLAGLTLGVSAETVKLGWDKSGPLMPIKSTSGEVTLTANFVSPDRGCWMWVKFFDANKKQQMAVRIDPDKTLYYPEADRIGAAVNYQKKLAIKTDFAVKVTVGDGRYYNSVINGEKVPGLTDKKAKIAFVQIAGHGCELIYKDLKWTEQKAGSLKLELFGNTGINSQKFYDVPAGDYELTFKFKVADKGVKQTHYGVEIGSGNNNKERVMLVFWKQGFQMIQGANNKWLGNFDVKTFETKSHAFKLKKSDGDFYEVFIDGKLINSFEAEVSDGGVFSAWSYGKWLFNLENIQLKKVTE